MPSASYPFICYSTFRYSIYHSSTEAGPEANVSGPGPEACALIARGGGGAGARRDAPLFAMPSTFAAPMTARLVHKYELVQRRPVH